jgi:hypothetical protein
VTEPAKKKWEEIGRSKTTPVEDKKRAEVKIDSFYVVVGFEVNHADAFVDGTHILNKDYGHAFYYLVRNTTIIAAYSFGPIGLGKVGWFNGGDSNNPNAYNRGAVIKNGYMNARKGTPDYPITEVIKAFKVKITPGQGAKLLAETTKMRAEIVSGDYKYNASMNDTCAESAKEILDTVDIDTPSGSGAIKHEGFASFPLVYAVNPYKWHANFKKAGYAERTFTPAGIPAPFLIPVGSEDMIFDAGS